MFRGKVLVVPCSWWPLQQHHLHALCESAASAVLCWQAPSVLCCHELPFCHAQRLLGQQQEFKLQPLQQGRVRRRLGRGSSRERLREAA